MLLILGATQVPQQTSPKVESTAQQQEVKNEIQVSDNKPQPLSIADEKSGSDKVSRDTNVSQASNNQPQVFRGKVSTYTATYGGCLGCTKHYDEKGQLYFNTASGDRLDDSKFTLAFNRLPLGTYVSLVNLSNGKSIAAKVNDRGGFESCCNRIADLSLATATAIGATTDRDTIEIREIPK